MTGLDQIREAVADYLNQNGVKAVTAWAAQPRDGAGVPVCAVSLRRCEAVGSAFCDYLGERYNPETASWQALYGKRVEVTLGLDLYAGADAGGEEAIRAAFDALAGALQNGGPEGLRLERLTCGETEFDVEEGRYRCGVEAAGRAFLCAAAEEGELFLDFVLKGEWKH